MKHTRQSTFRTVALAGSAALLLLATGAQAQNMVHGDMNSHRSMGSFSGSRPHSSFAPMGSFAGTPQMGSFSRMPPPPAPTGAMSARGNTVASPTGTGTTRMSMAENGTRFHHRRFDDDDDFFFDAFPFPDPFFADYVAPSYYSSDNEYWYWCPSSQAYFPWVRSCAVPWQPVPAD